MSSDETPNDFTRTDGTQDHYEHLDQAPHDGDDDYLRSDAFGTETAHKAAVSLAGRQVVAVQPVAMARLEEQGDDELEVEIGSGSESSGRVSMGPVNTVGYTLLRGPILSEDPDTSEPWTQAALSDATITLEHVAPGS
ncbi:MAG: hypothetical protein EA351_00065 [Gemmatimonadales bacterium]|nr:MAG: hypothetical protein EA351_00065 [Gemmatimonadales bacterium]